MDLVHVDIVNGDSTTPDCFVRVVDGHIEAVGRMTEYARQSAPTETLDLGGKSILPGFIDEHIHGSGMADVMDGTEAALRKISTDLIREGVTSYLATTMTDSSADIDVALENVADYVSNHKDDTDAAEIIGVHLEGPFISCERSGGQNPENIMKPDSRLLDEFNRRAQGEIRLVTYAPEEATVDFTRHLVETGIVPSAGHSSVMDPTLQKHIDAGLTNVTHLFNAMSPVHHRDLGLAFSGLTRPELNVELIVDGHHVNPAMVKFAYQLKAAKGVSLITDAMRAKNCPDGEYIHGGMKVIKEDGTVRLPNGTLSGSVLHVDEAVRNMRAFTGCSLNDIVKMTSENQAHKLGLDTRKGRIAEGFDADFAVLDSADKVVMTIKRGEIGYTA